MATLPYTFEQFHIQFNKKLEKNKRYQISVVTKPQSTEVYVDGEKVERIANPANPRFAHNSLVCRLKRSVVSKESCIVLSCQMNHSSIHV